MRIYTVGIKVAARFDGKLVSIVHKGLPTLRAEYSIGTITEPRLGKLFVYNPMLPSISYISRNDSALLCLVVVDSMIPTKMYARYDEYRTAEQNIRDYWSNPGPTTDASTSIIWHAYSVLPLLDITEATRTMCQVCGIKGDNTLRIDHWKRIPALPLIDDIEDILNQYAHWRRRNHANNQV